MNKMKIITSVGVELEGAYKRALVGSLSTKYGNRFVRSRDCSVRIEKEGYDISDGEFLYWNESPSKVLEFVKTMFDTGFFQNQSCGNHIHIRFMPMAVGFLSFEQSRQMFLEEWRKLKISKNTAKLQLKEQLTAREKNGFCKFSFPEQATVKQIQSRYKGCDRYTIINYNPLRKQRTVEFRLLPFAKNYEQYEYMFKWLLRTIKHIFYVAQKMDCVIGERRINIQKENYNPIIPPLTIRKVNTCLNELKVIKLEVR